MQTPSWLPSRTSALPVQQLVELNRLSLPTTTGARADRLADPMFLNRMQMAPSSEATSDQASQADGRTTPAPVLASPSQAGLSLLDSLRGLSPAALKFEQRASSFEFNSEEIATEQLESQPESAEQAMQQFVGETLYGMLMKQMRNTVVQSDLYGNSSAKRMFESQLDQTLVQELATKHSDFLGQPIRI